MGGYHISGRGYPISGLDGGGYPGTPDQVWMMGGTPFQVWMVGDPGYPPPRPGLDGGVLHLRFGWWGGTWGTLPPTMRQSSIASTCYAAGGVPLAFTQEDFLVIVVCSHFNLRNYCATLQISVVHLCGVWTPTLRYWSNSVADPGFSRGGGANPKGGRRQPIIWPFFLKNCMKMENFWARGGHAPLRSAAEINNFI